MRQERWSAFPETIFMSLTSCVIFECGHRLNRSCWKGRCTKLEGAIRVASVNAVNVVAIIARVRAIGARGTRANRWRAGQAEAVRALIGKAGTAIEMARRVAEMSPLGVVAGATREVAHVVGKVSCRAANVRLGSRKRTGNVQTPSSFSTPSTSTGTPTKGSGSPSIGRCPGESA